MVTGAAPRPFSWQALVAQEPKVVPVIAVSRVSDEQLAVVVPDEAAPTVRTVELLHGGGRGSGSRQWLIRRDGKE